MASSLTERLTDQEVKSRQVLLSAALNQLKDLRVQLDVVFEEADAGNDPFMKKVRPQAVLLPAQEFVRLFTLQTRLTSFLDRAQGASRVSFWFLLAFVLTMFASTVLGVVEPTSRPLWSVWTLVTGAAVFLIGGFVFSWVLLHVRAIDRVHVEVARMLRDDQRLDLPGEE